MSAVLSMLIEADANQAKAELDSTSKAVGKVGDATDKLGQKNRSASSDTKNLGAAATDVANQVQSLAETEWTAAEMATELGTAFFQMLNPVSLITIGSIAAGAAMVGWLRDAWPEAVSLDDAMKDLEAGIADYARAVKAAGAPTDELKEKFGEAASEARLVLADLAEASFRDRRREIVASFQGITDELGFANSRYSQGVRRRIMADQFDLSTRTKENREFIDAVIKDIADFSKAADLPIEAQIAAIDKLVISYRSAAEASGGLSDEEASQLQGLQQIQIDLLELLELSKNGANKSGEKALESARLLLVELENEVVLQATIAAHGKDSIQVNELRRASEQRVFEETLATLDVSKDIKDELRGAFQAGQDLNYANMSDGIRAASQYASELVDRIVAAAGAAQSLAQQGEASLKESELRVTYVNDPVKLAGELARLKMSAIQEPLRDGANAGESAYLDQQLNEYVRNQEEIAQNNQQQRELSKKGRSGFDSSSELAKLIERERDEIAILREYDPVQKELLKNRKALSGATDEERVKVEALISQRIQEQIRVDALQESYDFWGQTTLGIFDDLFVAGKSLDDVIGNLASSLAFAAWQATILGTGPLASMFGVEGSGGIFGGLFGGLFGQKRAEGGLIYGPGGPTEDKVLTFTSPGEYVVRAIQTSKYLPLLEAINSGSLDHAPGFANGGMIGGSTPILPLITRSPVVNANGDRTDRAAQTGGLLRVELLLSDDLDGRIDARSEGVAVRIIRSGLDQFSSESLPVRFKQIANDERAIG